MVVPALIRVNSTNNTQYLRGKEEGKKISSFLRLTRIVDIFRTSPATFVPASTDADKLIEISREHYDLPMMISIRVDSLAVSARGNCCTPAPPRLSQKRVIRLSKLRTSAFIR